MQYHEDNDIKGDFNVDARGVSSLLVQDQQAMALGQIFQLRGDPVIEKEVDWQKAIHQYFSFKQLDILKTDVQKAADEKAMADQPPQVPPNPALEVANVRVQGELEKAKLVQSSDMSELEYKASEAERERQHEKEMKAIDYQIKLMEYAEKRNISLDKIKADLAQTSEKLNLQAELSKPGGAGGEVVAPAVEPGPIAAPGRSFQE